MILPIKEPETVLELLKNIAAILGKMEEILGKMEEEITEVIEKYGISADPRREQPEQVEIQHVGYDEAQCGREK